MISQWSEFQCFEFVLDLKKSWCASSAKPGLKITCGFSRKKPYGKCNSKLCVCVILCMLTDINQKWFQVKNPLWSHLILIKWKKGIFLKNLVEIGIFFSYHLAKKSLGVKEKRKTRKYMQMHLWAKITEGGKLKSHSIGSPHSFFLKAFFTSVVPKLWFVEKY